MDCFCFKKNIDQILIFSIWGIVFIAHAAETNLVDSKIQNMMTDTGSKGIIKKPFALPADQLQDIGWFAGGWNRIKIDSRIINS